MKKTRMTKAFILDKKSRPRYAEKLETLLVDLTARDHVPTSACDTGEHEVEGENDLQPYFAYGAHVYAMTDDNNAAIKSIRNREMLRLNISWIDFYCLDGENFLNDNIISAFGLTKLNQSKLPGNISILSSLFYEQSERANEFVFVESTRHSLYWDILGREHLLIPIHLNSSHWALLHIDIPMKKVLLYDSLASKPSYKHEKVLTNVRCFIEKEYQRRENSTDISKWIFTVGKSEQQNDGFNCGVFVCRFIEIIIESLSRFRVCGEEITKLSECFSLETPAEMRTRIGVEIRAYLFEILHQQ